LFETSSATFDEDGLIAADCLFLGEGGDVAAGPAFHHDFPEKMEIGVSPVDVDGAWVRVFLPFESLPLT
jgi:hypothetical protein